jgi:nitrogen fixation NifU-like protein
MTAEKKHTDDDHELALMDARFWTHARTPSFTTPLASVDAEGAAVGSCGDAMRIRIAVNEGRIAGIQHIPDGCVYTIACASAVSALANGIDLEAALTIQPDHVAGELGGLPDDHLHCARLAVNTLGEAIADYYGRQRQRKETTVADASIP